MAAIPDGMISGFFRTCLFGGCDSCSFCDFGGSGSGLEGTAAAGVCECVSAGGGSELCLTGWCTGGGGGGGDMLLDLTGAGGQLVRWWSMGDLEKDNQGKIHIALISLSKKSSSDSINFNQSNFHEPAGAQGK